MSDTVGITLLIPIDRENGQKVWTEDVECEGALWSCDYKFEDDVLFGYVNCNKRYLEFPELDMWKYSARNQFIISKEGKPNITTELRDKKNEYYMRVNGVPLLAYREMVCARRLLKNYADERGLFKVVVNIMEIENLLPDQNSDEFALNPGDVILRKSQETFFGHGGDATVYKGEYKGNMVAIKEFHIRELGSKDYFKDELERFRQLRHPNLLKLIGYVSKKRFIVLELCSNGTLYTHIHNLSKEIDWRRLDNWVTDIIEGMAFLHKNDVTHRDLKTANILIGADCSLQITDFARAKSGPISMMSVVTSRVGTVGYMAPELLSIGEDGKNTRKIDVWSFGVILWELCTRYLPYDGLSETEVYLRTADRELKLPDLPALPVEIRSLINRCLSFEPKDRPSFEEIKDDHWTDASCAIRRNKNNWPKIAEDCHEFAKSHHYAPRSLRNSLDNTVIARSSIESLQLSDAPEMSAEEVAAPLHQTNVANQTPAPGPPLSVENSIVEEVAAPLHQTNVANQPPAPGPPQSVENSIVENLPGASNGAPLQPVAPRQLRAAWEW